MSFTGTRSQMTSLSEGARITLRIAFLAMEQLTIRKPAAYLRSRVEKVELSSSKIIFSARKLLNEMPSEDSTMDRDVAWWALVLDSIDELGSLRASLTTSESPEVKKLISETMPDRFLRPIESNVQGMLRSGDSKGFLLKRALKQSSDDEPAKKAISAQLMDAVFDQCAGCLGIALADSNLPHGARVILSDLQSQIDYFSSGDEWPSPDRSRIGVALYEVSLYQERSDLALGTAGTKSLNNTIHRMLMKHSLIQIGNHTYGAEIVALSQPPHDAHQHSDFSV
ncbi:hypothetical protein [Marinobacter sp. ELB17]|uniref:hypothetical protein n=1 Tax=Marinobacter sp. ELB17 TaxID=270374 RepID=UPI0000F38223|nr:hypothetical protein [Marinobacter sp. ELB17]EAZ98140.1 hypothetical protein MELB17_09658 [Marinobacter sp. ELB17]